MTEDQRKLLQKAVKEGLKIQDRFAAEPVYAKTGKGYLKSEGVGALEKIKDELKLLPDAGAIRTE